VSSSESTPCQCEHPQLRQGTKSSDSSADCPKRPFTSRRASDGRAIASAVPSRQLTAWLLLSAVRVVARLHPRLHSSQTGPVSHATMEAAAAAPDAIQPLPQPSRRSRSGHKLSCTCVLRQRLEMSRRERCQRCECSCKGPFHLRILLSPKKQAMSSRVSVVRVESSAVTSVRGPVAQPHTTRPGLTACQCGKCRLVSAERSCDASRPCSKVVSIGKQDPNLLSPSSCCSLVRGTSAQSWSVCVPSVRHV
jgi:hypothetical protein